jgi:tetratricopeptide (TPR) repeat protein
MVVSQTRESTEICGLIAALDSHTAQFGACHPRTIAIVNRLAIAFWNAGDVNRAVSVLDQALESSDSSLDREHRIRAYLLCTLGEIMVDQERLENAGSIYREVLDLRIRACGQNHPSSLAAMGDLAQVLFELGRTEEATRLERRPVKRRGPVSAGHIR